MKIHIISRLLMPLFWCIHTSANSEGSHVGNDCPSGKRHVDLQLSQNCGSYHKQICRHSTSFKVETNLYIKNQWLPVSEFLNDPIGRGAKVIYILGDSLYSQCTNSKEPCLYEKLSCRTKYEAGVQVQYGGECYQTEYLDVMTKDEPEVTLKIPEECSEFPNNKCIGLDRFTVTSGVLPDGTSINYFVGQKEMTPCRNLHSCSISGLRPDTMYSVNLRVFYPSSCNKTHSMKISTRGLPMVTMTQEEQGLVKWTPDWTLDSPRYRVTLQWRSKKCGGRHSRKQVFDQVLTTDSYKIDLKSYEYSYVWISVSSYFKQAEGPKETLQITNDQHGRPETNILSIKCSSHLDKNPHCSLQMNYDCMLIKSPNIWIGMTYKVVDQSLARRKGASGHTKTLVEKSRVEVPFLENWIPFSQYQLEFRVQNEAQDFDPSLTQIRNITSPPAAPGAIRNLVVIPAVTSVVLSFKKPADKPLKGKLLSIKVTFSQKPNWPRWQSREWVSRKYSVDNICSQQDCKIDISPLKSNYEYTYEVRAINEGVDSPGPMTDVKSYTKTKGPPDVTINKNSRGSLVKWKVNAGILPTDLQFRVVVMTKSLACNGEDYVKQVDQMTSKYQMKVDWSEYFYSKIKVSVESHSKNTLGKKDQWVITNNKIKAPETSITSLDCSKDTTADSRCVLILDKNCMLRKSKSTFIYMSYEVQNVTLVHLEQAKGSQAFEYNFDKNLILPYGSQWIPFSLYKLQFQVANEQGVANSTLTKTVQVMTKSAAPGPVQSVSYTASATSVNVSFIYPEDIPPRGILSKFLVLQTQSSSRISTKTLDPFPFRDICSVTTKSCKITIKGLKPETSYTFTISAFNYGSSQPSEAKQISATTLLPDPVAVTITGIDTSTWKIEIQDSNKMITSYHVQVSEDLDVAFEQTFSHKQTLSVAVTKLFPSTEYTVRVSACRDNKCSNMSAPITIWTKPKAFDVPSPEKNIPLTNETSVAVNLIDLPDKINSYEKCLAVVQEGETVPQLSEDPFRSCFTSHPCNDDMTGPIDTCRLTDPKKKVEYFKVDDTSKGYHFLYIFRATSGDHVIMKMSEKSGAFRAGKNSSASLALGFGFGLPLLVAVCGLSFVAYRRFFGQKDKINDEESLVDLQNGSQTDLMKQKEPANTVPLMNISKKRVKRSLSSPKQLEPLPCRVELHDVEQYLLDAIDSPELDDIYKSVPLSMPGMTTTIASSAENQGKNRYKNILPYDQTRVKLAPNKFESSSGYINANYIHTESRKKAFIATQGPKDDPKSDTMEDFWRMTWNSNASHIVMVANFVEGKKKKVGKYFPTDGSLVLGAYSVTIDSTTNKGDYVIRDFIVTDGTSEKRVLHYQYTAWPDHGIPENCVTLAKMIEELVPQMDITRPVIVHCSAGIGRTGTILLILTALEQMAFGYLNMVELLENMRKCRPRLVEKSQFRYAHSLLLEVWLKSMRHSTLESIYSNVDEAHDRSQEEYNRLKKLVLRPVLTQLESPEFQKKHRNPSIIPAASNRVVLKGCDVNDINTYLPAIWIKGLLRQKNFIVMEHPTTLSLDLALSLIHEKQIKKWLFLNTYGKNEKEFPGITSNSNDNFILTVKETSKSDHCTHKTMNLQKKSTGSGEAHEFKLIEYLCWPYGSKEPKEHTALLKLAQDLALDPSQPAAIITCGNGYTACGVFLAICIEIQRSKYTEESGVYLTSLRLLMDHAHFLQSQSQYKFIYEALRDYREA